MAQHLATVVLAPRVRSNHHLATGQAALELFLRLSRARQTVDFTRRQVSVVAVRAALAWRKHSPPPPPSPPRAIRFGGGMLTTLCASALLLPAAC